MVFDVDIGSDVLTGSLKRALLVGEDESVQGVFGSLEETGAVKAVTVECARLHVQSRRSISEHDRSFSLPGHQVS